MAAISDDYLKVLQANPEQSVNIIIRTNAASAANTAQLQSLGLTVTRTYKLISAVAASGPARAVIALASVGWVESVEPDQDVKAL